MVDRKGQKQPKRKKKGGPQRSSNPFRRRDILILVAVWLVGCTIVSALLGLFYMNSVEQTVEPIRPLVTPVVLSTQAEYKAKSAYIAAAAEAQNWRDDAELVAISAQWVDATLESLNQPVTWDFRFFSSGRQRLLFIVVAPGAPIASRTHLAEVTYNPSPVDPATWSIDSDEALSIWLTNGGSAFIEAFSGNRVELLLRKLPASNQTIWDIIGLNQDQTQLFYLSIDAANGQVLNQN